jgi:pimeloyl-ACP methyl ester carboxylesterase
MKIFVLNGWAASKCAWDLCTFPRERVFSYIEQLDGVPEDVLQCEDEVILVGWSMGGSSALRLAAKMPEKIRGLVLVAAPARMMNAPEWPGMTERRLAALEIGLKMTLSRGEALSDQRAINPYIADSDENLSRGLDYLRVVDVRSDLEACRASGALNFPVYIFQSERDAVVRRENVGFLEKVFPHAVVSMIPGEEHALPLAIPSMIDDAVKRIFTASGG